MRLRMLYVSLTMVMVNSWSHHDAQSVYKLYTVPHAAHTHTRMNMLFSARITHRHIYI